MPRIKTLREPCGCIDKETLYVMCRFHWNLMIIASKLQECRQWERDGKLDPNVPADAVVLAFYRDLVYWAAKGATAAEGLVGTRW